MAKIWKALLRMSYITDQPLVVYWLFSQILHLDMKVKMNKILYIWFLMGIDYSNPYTHSTTVLCDNSCRVATTGLVVMVKTHGADDSLKGRQLN